MWFYEQISGNKVIDPTAADTSAAAANKDAAAVAVEQTNTYEVTSGDEDSSTGSVATPVSQPDANNSEEETEQQPDEGIEVLHFLSTSHKNDARSKASSTISKSTTRSISGSVAKESVKEASTSNRSLEVTDSASKSFEKSLSTSSSAAMVNSSRNIFVEEEKGAIEVEAAGVGFALSSWEDLKDVITVLTSNGSDEGSPDASSKSTNKKRRKYKMEIIAFAVITALCLVALLAVGVKKNFSKNKKSALIASTLKEDDAAAVDPSTTQATDALNVTSTFAPSANATQASPPVRQDDDEGEDIPGWWDGQETGTENPTVPPTFAQTVAATAASTTAGTTLPTDISCGDDHNLIVASECQSDGVESWTSTRILFCFSRTRDGDWYWIRSADGDYDQWDYTEGESEGMVEVDSISAGDYLVSLVRDSMQPYDILLTETVTVPDCSSASA